MIELGSDRESEKDKKFCDPKKSYGTKNEFGYGGLPPPPSLFTAEIDKVAFYNPPSSSNQFVFFLVLHSGKLSPSPPVPPTH